MSDPGTGAFLLAAGVGSFLRLDVTYENHTFAINMLGTVDVREGMSGEWNETPQFLTAQLTKSTLKKGVIKV